ARGMFKTRRQGREERRVFQDELAHQLGGFVCNLNTEKASRRVATHDRGLGDHGAQKNRQIPPHSNVAVARDRTLRTALLITVNSIDLEALGKLWKYPHIGGPVFHLTVDQQQSWPVIRSLCVVQFGTIDHRGLFNESCTVQCAAGTLPIGSVASNVARCSCHTCCQYDADASRDFICVLPDVQPPGGTGQCCAYPSGSSSSSNDASIC